MHAAANAWAHIQQENTENSMATCTGVYCDISPLLPNSCRVEPVAAGAGFDSVTASIG